MEKFFIQLIGYILIWWAITIGRKEDSKVELFTSQWVLQILLVAIGVSIIVKFS